MEKVTLIFDSELQLRGFLEVVKANFLNINAKNKTVTCDCSQAEISLAVTTFGAKVAEHGNIFK